MGIYFGKLDGEPESPTQAILLMQNTDDDYLEFPVLAIRYFIDVTNDSIHHRPPQVAVPYSVKLPRTVPGECVPLELTFVDGALTSVKWRLQELGALCHPKLNEAFAGLPVKGQFGLVNWLTSGITYERAEIRTENEISTSK